jgi:hypothetical protein
MLEDPSGYIHKDDLPKLLPGKVHRHTVVRWHVSGLPTAHGERVYLRMIRIGSRLYSRREWLEEFLQALSEPAAAAKRSKPVDVERRALEAGRALQAAGA